MDVNWCAYKIANLEGRKRFMYRPRSEMAATIEALDMRLRRLEQATGLRSQHPTLVPTMELLEYRIREVQGQMAGPISTLAFKDTKTATCPPKTLEEIDRVMECVYVLVDCKPGPADLPDPEAKEPEKLFDAAQRMCYIAGWRYHNVVDFEDNATQVYELALGLHMLLGRSNSSHSRPGIAGPLRVFPPPPPPMGLPGRRIWHNPKQCCGCCSCHCHGDKPGLSLFPKRPWYRRGFLGKLWCFGRRNQTGSVSSGSTVTVDELAD